MSAPANRSRPPRAVVFGCAGPVLSVDERRLFADADPLGLILFARNCRSPGQVCNLVADFRAAVGRSDAPVLIDQEGGRVARLGPPHWRVAPAAARFAALARTDLAGAVEAARLNARLMAAEMQALGITVDCAPVLDVPQPGADPIIGDRAHGDTPEQVATLGAAVCEGLLSGGVLPVVKHVPGHGRATVDSHKALPVVRAAREELERTDFPPFRRLAGMPWAMTAHVVYAAVDPERPATTSAKVIGEIIRGAIGFQGVLLSDDIEMQALAGACPERAAAALAAGCDVVLYCNGTVVDFAAVAERVPPLTPPAQARLARAETVRLKSPAPFDPAAAEARLAELLEPVATA